jgi:hypothetical protein
MAVMIAKIPGAGGWLLTRMAAVTQRFLMHADNPQRRLVQQAVAILRDGGLMVYPTDSSYAFGCQMGARDAVARIERLRQTGKDHNFTLHVPRPVRNRHLRAHRQLDLPAAALAHAGCLYLHSAAPRGRCRGRLQNPEAAAPSGSGCRITRCRLRCSQALGEPLMSSSLILPG